LERLPAARKILTFRPGERNDYQQADRQSADDTSAGRADRPWVREGDEIAYAIEDGRVILTKARSEAAEDPFGAFQEWDGEADRKAYGKL
jgi:hypothetical protein